MRYPEFLILYAALRSPRSFLGAPENDRVVDPHRNTQQLADKLAANGVGVTYKRYPHASHMTILAAIGRPLRWLAPVLDDVEQFIRTKATP
jgi:acetyl esterase/lipase